MFRHIEDDLASNDLGGSSYSPSQNKYFFLNSALKIFQIYIFFLHIIITIINKYSSIKPKDRVIIQILVVSGLSVALAGV